MNKKKIVIVVVVVILAVGAGLWVLENRQKEISLKNNSVQNQQNAQSEQKNDETQEIDMSDWKTYINDGWGYSIKYPPNLFIKPNAQGDKFPGDESMPYDGGQTLIISDKEKMGIQDVMPDERIHIRIITSKMKVNQSLVSYLKELYSIKDITGNDNIKISEILLNGVNAYEIQFKSKQPYISIFLNKNDWAYQLHGINFIDENVDSYNFKLMKKIISTFEFKK